MTLKQFDLFLARIQVHGHSMWEESLRQFVLKGEKQPTYNQWEREIIISAVKNIEFI